MTPKHFQRRSLELTPAQWAAMEAMAAANCSIAPNGPNAGQPSWRSFIKDIANQYMAEHAAFDGPIIDTLVHDNGAIVAEYIDFMSQPGGFPDDEDMEDD